MEIDFVDYILFFIAIMMIFLLLLMFLDPDHEFHVVIVVLEHKDYFLIFVPTFGGSTAKVKEYLS